jgi:rRNA maturation endonuclease Nob1
MLRFYYLLLIFNGGSVKKVFSVLFLSSLFLSLQGVGFSQKEYEEGQKRVLLLMKARELLDRSPVEGRDAAEQDVRKAERSLRRRSSLTPRLSQKDLEKMRTMHEREEQARANVAEGFESPQMGSVSSEDAVQ